MQVVNLEEKFAKFQEHFTPRLAAEVNDFHVKLVKVKGEFMWHHHDHEDEMFLVMKGELHMKYRGSGGEESEAVIRPGEFIVVPHGAEHMPYAVVETHVLLFEPGTTLNTGTAENERTVRVVQKI